MYCLENSIWTSARASHWWEVHIDTAMAWSNQATSHYLNQHWPRSIVPYSVTRPQWVKKKDRYIFDHSHILSIHIEYDCCVPSTINPRSLDNDMIIYAWLAIVSTNDEPVHLHIYINKGRIACQLSHYNSQQVSVPLGNTVSPFATTPTWTSLHLDAILLYLNSKYEMVIWKTLNSSPPGRHFQMHFHE